MSTLGEKNIADISAEEITSAVNQVRNPAPVAANNVPASVLTAPQTPEVAIPEAQTPQVNAGAAIAGAEQITGSLQAQEAQREERRVEQIQGGVSEQERKVRESVGILGTEPATRARMEEESGLNDAQKQLNQMSNQLFNQTAELRQFDVQFGNFMEGERIAMGKRGGTKAQFGNFSAEQNQQMAVQRANMVGELYATQSSVQLMQGNIELAAKSIDKALDAIYEPKRLEHQMEMMFLQRNWQLLDSAQNRAANARMEAIKQEQKQIDRAEEAVYNAVQNGYATADEVQEMMSLSDDPRAQFTMASVITNRGAAQERGLRIEQLNMSIAASKAQIKALSEPNPLDSILLSLFEPEQEIMSFEEFQAQAVEGLQGPITPAQYTQIEQAYGQAVKNRGQDKNTTISFLLAKGAITPQVADDLRANLRVTTPKDQERQKDAAIVANTVLRDLDDAINILSGDDLDKVAGFSAERALDRIEIRTAKEPTTPFLGRWHNKQTEKLTQEYSQANDLKRKLDSISSNISVDSLNAMRKNSPGGGALGNVSEKQSAMLASLKGDLSIGQSPDQLKKTAQDTYNLFLDVIYGDPDDISNALRSGKIDHQSAVNALEARKQASFQMYGLTYAESGGQDITSVRITPDGKLIYMTN